MIKQRAETHLRNTTSGNILISPTCGGSFSGKESGSVLPVGALYSKSLRACETDLELKLLMKTEKDEQILMEFRGLLNTTPEIEEKFAAQDDDVDLEQIYAGGTAVFLTDEERLKYLERKIYACSFMTAGWDNFVIKVVEPEI